MSLLQVIGKGSPVKVLEGQSHKQPELCGEIGRVVDMPGMFLAYFEALLTASNSPLCSNEE